MDKDPNEIENDEIVFESLVPDPPDEPVPPEEEAPKTEEPGQPKKSLMGLGMTAIVAIVAIIAIVSGFIVMQRAQVNAKAARNRIAQGQAAMVDGDLFLALYQFTMALELDPRIAGAHSALGGIAIANSHADMAVDHFRQELAINPGDRKSHLALGCIYSLACVPEGDPDEIQPYLLSKFGDVVPLRWPDELDYTPPPDVYPLSEAVIHFETASEQLPDDPAPIIGLALTQIASNNLEEARDMMAALMAETSDENTILIAHRLIQDINAEEQYRQMVAMLPSLPDEEEEVTEIPLPREPVDFTGALNPLPPMPGSDGRSFGSLSTGQTEAGGFGFRGFGNVPDGQTTGPEFTTTITRESLSPRPTIKPVSNDITLPDTGEVVHTVRIANMYQLGNVGFREGETIVMPNTNVEVTVTEASDDRIVLEERGFRFVWVRGDVGWELESSETIDSPGRESLDITAYNPSELPNAEEATVEEETTEEEVTPEDEMGPDVGSE